MLDDGQLQSGQGGSDPSDSVWQACIPFVQEMIIRPKEVVSL